MSANVFQELKGRGFVKQLTADESVFEKLLKDEKITIYAGFDPTKDSLHVGHLIPIMALSHLQQAGHRPVCVVGGATALIGDPSGKDSMREMLTPGTIEKNIIGIRRQLSRFIEFREERALLLNNYEWFGNERYIEFIRDIGPFFTVNRMLTAECFKQRMEKGLTFLEFNYMLLQAFDFYTLSRKYNCRMEIGGDDQWSNILAGIELVRRKDQKEVFGLTSPLLTTAGGKKMGKTEGGAVWLNGEMTSPYEYFQFWRNTMDADVVKFMKLYTYLPLEEISKYEQMEGAELNKAKEVLAYEATKIVHGQEEADKSLEAAKNVFSGGNAGEGAPTVEIEKEALLNMKVIDLAIHAGLFATKGEAKRMIQQGGLKINDEKVTDIHLAANEKDIKEGKIALQKGKKKFVFVKVK